MTRRARVESKRPMKPSRHEEYQKLGTQGERTEVTCMRVLERPAKNKLSTVDSLQHTQAGKGKNV